MSTEDRRAPGTQRMPFDGMVEVGGALGPSFEAQAVNLSEDGMLLRTAYLPDPGQPLTCRFDAGSGQSVLASGEVVWSQAADKGGEFAIRFTDMDPESVEALKHACGVVPASAPQAQPGQKVRLHIEGLASPMRAKIKDAFPSEITVGSDLGFLQVGKQLELEDAQSGAKRPAAIDRVEVAIDPASNVPQLVVTLRYADVEAEAGEPRAARPAQERAPAKAAGAPASEAADVEDASMQMKGSVARSFARIGPAMERFATRAKTTIALLAARRSIAREDGAAPRRTTAPPPGGGLHAEGRRVVRGEPSSASLETAGIPKMKITRQKAMIAGGVMAFAIVGAVVLKKTHHEPAAAAGAQDPHAPAPTALAADTSTPPPAPVPTTAPAALPLDPTPAFANTPSQPEPIAEADDDSEPSGKGGHHKHLHVAPFGNGPVHHGNILHLKMDGPIESIEGAQQPTGFAVKLPGRKSLEAAGPLASRDSRIAAIKVANDGAGAELTVAFKDGVPNYQVRASGDTLVIALAPAGSLEHAVAKNDGKGAHASKHAKHEHKKNDSH